VSSQFGPWATTGAPIIDNPVFASQTFPEIEPCSGIESCRAKTGEIAAARIINNTAIFFISSSFLLFFSLSTYLFSSERDKEQVLEKTLKKLVFKEHFSEAKTLHVSYTIVQNPCHNYQKRHITKTL
jgi:hypothetical protein